MTSTASQSTREVDARNLGEASVGALERVPHTADLAHDDVGGCAPDNEVGAVDRDRSRARTRHQIVQQRTRDRTAVAMQQGDRDRRRHVRSGRARAAELLDHDRLLEQTAVAGVQPDPPRLCERVPEVGPGVGGRVERGPCGGGRNARVDEAAHGMAKVLVFLGDPDRHRGKLLRDARHPSRRQSHR